MVYHEKGFFFVGPVSVSPQQRHCQIRLCRYNNIVAMVFVFAVIVGVALFTVNAEMVFCCLFVFNPVPNDSFNATVYLAMCYGFIKQTIIIIMAFIHSK